MTEPTLEQFKEYLKYDPDTGAFTWIKRKGNTLPGTVVSHVCQDGYIRLGFNRKSYYGHRLAWLFYYGTWPKNFIDHIDRNKLNNRISNLRDVPHCINVLNRNSVATITKTTNRWRARISVGGVPISLGYYASESEAISATDGLKEKILNGLVHYYQNNKEFKKENISVIAKHIAHLHLAEYSGELDKMLEQMKQENKLFNEQYVPQQLSFSF